MRNAVLVLALLLGVWGAQPLNAHAQSDPPDRAEYCQSLRQMFLSPRDIATEAVYRAGFNTTSPHAVEVLDHSRGMMTVVAWLAHYLRTEQHRPPTGRDLSELSVYVAGHVMDREMGIVNVPTQEAQNARDAELIYCGWEQ